jgi:hypothetical protein
MVPTARPQPTVASTNVSGKATGWSLPQYPSTRPTSQTRRREGRNLFPHLVRLGLGGGGRTVNPKVVEWIARADCEQDRTTGTEKKRGGLAYDARGAGGRANERQRNITRVGDRGVA